MQKAAHCSTVMALLTSVCALSVLALTLSLWQPTYVYAPTVVAPTVVVTGEADVLLVVVMAMGEADVVLVVVLATGEVDVVLVIDDDNNDESSYSERPFGPPQISVTLPSQVIEHRPSVTRVEPAKSVLPQ